MNYLKEIEKCSEWEMILENSSNASILLLKHSTRCPISAAAYKEYEKFSQSHNAIACYVVKVIENKEISNAIAMATGVKHESPQIHLIQNGKSVWNVSHRQITQENISAAFEKY